MIDEEDLETIKDRKPGDLLNQIKLSDTAAIDCKGVKEWFQGYLQLFAVFPKQFLIKS